MFHLNISLQPFSLSGLDALDWRRAMGLPDGVRAYSPSGSRTWQCAVGEKFARSWFPRTETSMNVSVVYTMFAPGELRDYVGGSSQSGRIELADLSDERTQELFVAAKFHATKPEDVGF